METEDQLVLLFKEATLRVGGNNSEFQEPGSSMLEERLSTPLEVIEKTLLFICGLNITVPIKNGESNIFHQEDKLKSLEEELEEVREVDSGWVDHSRS
jgi:hypothetical protein